MKLFKSILVPVNLGSSTERVLRTAGEMAKIMDARVSVMHVVQPFPAVPLTSGIMMPEGSGQVNIPAYQKAVEERVQNAMGEIVDKTLPAERIAGRIVRTGTVGSTIVDECEKGDYDLVVIDSGEHDDIVTKIFGSVADKVVKSAKVPVLVLRGRPEEDDSEE